MPINPNIALGVQPIQQPNMLGQVGQMMALKAAQQESEGYEGVKNALSGGMSATDPRILQYGKRGIEAFRAAGEGRVKQIEVAKKQNEVLGSIFGGVLQDPTTGPQAVSRLVEMGVMSNEQAQKVIEQAGNNPETWRKLAKPYYEGAIDAEKRLTAETSIKTANIGAGATMRGQDLLEARERDKMALTAQEREILPGEGEFYQKDKFGNIYRVPSFGALRGPNAPAPAMPPAAANAFVTARPSVNAFAPTAPPQGAGPTVAAAAAMDAQQNIPRPKVPIRQPVAVMKDGKAVLVPPEQAVGMPPATADAEKAARLQAQQVRDLGLAITNLESAVKPGGLISQSTGSGLGRAYDVGAGFFGNAPEGAIAAAKLAPIADMVLKMVPRFEGPQSDKDTQSYKEAAGQLANPNLPTKLRQEAGKEILRLMKERKDQFVSTDMAKEGFSAAPKTVTRTGTLNGRKVVEYSDGTTAYAD